jgi:fucose 4-O-acetylase-like acetyltransferase
MAHTLVHCTASEKVPQCLQQHKNKSHFNHRGPAFYKCEVSALVSVWEITMCAMVRLFSTWWDVASWGGNTLYIFLCHSIIIFTLLIVCLLVHAVFTVFVQFVMQWFVHIVSYWTKIKWDWIGVPFKGGLSPFNHIYCNANPVRK